jgi:prolyl 4-hydroxylase
MSNKPLDAAWKAWLKENMDRRCDPRQLLAILLEQQFSIDSIRECMGPALTAGLPVVHGLTGRQLDHPWRAWAKENIDRGCDPQELLGILVKHGFSLDSIAEAMGAEAMGAEAMGNKFPGGPGSLEEALYGTSDEPDFRAISNPRLVRNKSGLKLQPVDTDEIQLYTLDDFMTARQCDDVAALIAEHLRPSTVTLPNTDRYFRTSSTCDLSLIHSAVVAALDERISQTLGIRLAYSEGIQGQRYQVGEEFKAHTDFFEPGTDEYREHATKQGNRTWTFMVYLNEDMEGGGTRFAVIGKTFQPRKGRALIWNNLYPDGTPNYDTLHSGMPVVRGHKIIITKWFREKGTGPMFYED